MSSEREQTGIPVPLRPLFAELSEAGSPAAWSSARSCRRIATSIRPRSPASPRSTHTGVGDWGSGAIAWVASHNHTRVLILRGVTDLVDAPGGDPTYHAADAWERASVAVMASLVGRSARRCPS